MLDFFILMRLLASICIRVYSFTCFLVSHTFHLGSFPLFPKLCWLEVLFSEYNNFFSKYYKFLTFVFEKVLHLHSGKVVFPCKHCHDFFSPHWKHCPKSSGVHCDCKKVSWPFHCHDFASGLMSTPPPGCL